MVAARGWALNYIDDSVLSYREFFVRRSVATNLSQKANLSRAFDIIIR